MKDEYQADGEMEEEEVEEDIYDIPPGKDGATSALLSTCTSEQAYVIGLGVHVCVCNGTRDLIYKFHQCRT